MAFNWDDHPIVQPAQPAQAAQPSQAFDWGSQPMADPRLAQLQAAKAQLAASQTPVQTPGALGSTALGLEQGATLGFAPRINAAALAAYKKITAPDSDYTQEYNIQKERQEELDKKAKASHPWLHGAGELAGGAAAALGTGGESVFGEGLLGAANLGATLGAAQGLSGTKDLSDINEDIKNAAVGGGVGALTGGVGSAATDVAGAILKPAIQGVKKATQAVGQLGPIARLRENYGVGRTEGLLVGNKVGNQALQESIAARNAAQDDFNDSLNSAQQQAVAMRQNAPTINMRDFYNDVSDAARNAKANAKFLDDREAIDRVHNTIKQFFLGAQDEDGNVLVNGTGFDVNPEDAVELKRKLGALGSEGDSPLNNQRGLAFVNRILSPLQRDATPIERSLGMPSDFVPLKDTINNSISGLPQNQREIYQMLNMKDEFPSIDTLVNAQKTGTVAMQNAKASNELDNFYNNLPPTVAASIKPALDRAASKAAQAAELNKSGLSENLLGIGGKGFFGGIGNIAGATVKGANEFASQAASNVASSGTGQLFKSMLNATPQAFTQAGSALLNSPVATAQYVGKALMGAASKDQVGRNAVIFALSQNPAYRDMLEKHVGGNGIEQEGPASVQGQNVRNNI